MKCLIGAGLMLVSAGLFAATDNTAKQLNQRCAPCHGLYGQGAPGASAPRLAGLPAWYLAKASRDYIKDARGNSLMMEVSGLNEMSDTDIDALSGWLSEQPVGRDPAYDIAVHGGDALAGKKKFNADCKECHARDGYGKKKKDAPPLAGQHPGYLLASMKAFFHKDRYHDNDPIDDTFDDISDTQARNIMAWTASLDDKKQQADYEFQPESLPLVAGEGAGYTVNMVQQVVLGTLAAKGVTVRAAISAMLARAAELEVPVVPKPPAESGQLPMTMHLTFCAPRHVSQLLEAAPVLANYDPCRVTLVQLKDGGLRLMTLNLDMLIDNSQLPPDAQRIAMQVNQDMLAIISAGAKGAEPAAQDGEASGLQRPVDQP